MYNKDHIKHWYKRAQEEESYTNKFISLWISFNAFYNSSEAKCKIVGIKEACKRSEGELAIIEKSCETFKDFKKLTSSPESCFKCFQQYILDKPDNPGFIQNMRHELSCKKSRGKEYSDVSCLSQYLRVVYQIRCNLFHGNKINDIEQDKVLIELACITLFEFLTSLYKENNHITGWED